MYERFYLADAIIPHDVCGYKEIERYQIIKSRIDSIIECEFVGMKKFSLRVPDDEKPLIESKIYCISNWDSDDKIKVQTPVISVELIPVPNTPPQLVSAGREITYAFVFDKPMHRTDFEIWLRESENPEYADFAKDGYDILTKPNISKEFIIKRYSKLK